MRLLYQKELLCGNDMVCCNPSLQEKGDMAKGEIGTKEMHGLVGINKA